MGLQVMGPAGETLSAGLNRNLPKESQEVKLSSDVNVNNCDFTMSLSIHTLFQAIN